MAAYRDKEDLIAIGAYQPGGDPTVDLAIAHAPRDRRLPAPAPSTEPSDLAEADARLAALSASHPSPSRHSCRLRPAARPPRPFAAA